MPRCSCRSPLANQMRLILHTAAYWLMLTVRDAIPKTHALATAEFREIQFHEPADVDPAFATIISDGLTALCVDSYIPVLASRDRIVELAAQHHVAAIYPFRHFVDAGGLLSYGSSLGENAKRAAVYVAKILHGAKPADLPVERSTKVELVINMTAARELGLTVPQTLLGRADESIE
jgi:putative ABC transport system substrate-binding protein